MNTTTFAITTAVNTIHIDAGGRGEIAYTVSNTSGQPLRGRAQIIPPQEAPAESFNIAGETERDFAAAGTQQYNIQITLPPEVKAGRYLLKLNMVGIKNPDEEFASGPSVTLEVGPREPVKKPFPWWVVLVGLGAIVIIAGLIFIIGRVTGNDDDVIVDEPITTLPEILEVMEIQDLTTESRVENVIIVRRQEIIYKYNLTNTSNSVVVPSSDNQFSRPLVGVRQHWIERLGANKSIPALPANTARDGDRFAIGGTIIPVNNDIAPGESLAFTETLDVTLFPADRYRIFVEYRDLDGQVVQTETVDFSVR